MRLETLSQRLRACRYPAQMEHVECGILGDGFYPGTKGFSSGCSPHGGIMLLGRDFGSRAYYKRLCGFPPRDETASTWLRTRDIYLASFKGLPVWCTNYIVGVRKDGSAVGNVKKRIEPSYWEKFESDCWQFLHAQVFLQHPRLVVVLGADNRDDLTANSRLGENIELEMQHRFNSDGRQHSARIAFADHPHSLIPKVRQLEALRNSERLRQLYECMEPCNCGDE